MLCLLFVWFSDFRRGFKYEFYITHTPRDPADKFLINIRFFALRSPPDKWLPFFNVTFCDGASEIEGISELVGCLWLLAIGGFSLPNGAYILKLKSAGEGDVDGNGDGEGATSASPSGAASAAAVASVAPSFLIAPDCQWMLHWVLCRKMRRYVRKYCTYTQLSVCVRDVCRKAIENILFRCIDKYIGFNCFYNISKVLSNLYGDICKNWEDYPEKNQLGL